MLGGIIGIVTGIVGGIPVVGGLLSSLLGGLPL